MIRRRMLPLQPSSARAMYGVGSRAWLRRRRGCELAAQIRAVQLAERVARPLGLGVRRVRRTPGSEAYVDVELVVPRRNDDLHEVIFERNDYPLEWMGAIEYGRGHAGVMATRYAVHGDTRDRCEWATTAHVPWCRCDECVDVPF